MTNYANKQRFVNELAEALELDGFKTARCLSGADKTIVRTTLETPSVQVTILADDTDILCLLLHHVFFSSSEKNIYLKNMRVESSRHKIIC